MHIQHISHAYSINEPSHWAQGRRKTFEAIQSAYSPRTFRVVRGSVLAVWRPRANFGKIFGHLGQCGFCTRRVRKSIHIPCIGHAYFTHIACTWHACSPCITSIFRAYSINIPYIFLVIPCIFRSYPMRSPYAFSASTVHIHS